MWHTVLGFEWERSCPYNTVCPYEVAPHMYAVYIYYILAEFATYFIFVGFIIISYFVPRGNKCKLWLEAELIGRGIPDITVSPFKNFWITCVSIPYTSRPCRINISPIWSNEMHIFTNREWTWSIAHCEWFLKWNDTIAVQLYVINKFINIGNEQEITHV